ncbi:hypothetical protein SDC64_05470 [Acinetobacter haemolyticus]|uniref:hypothetical protein n=1 Tax=Acinetobacter haemolyticus TaxID=29430 RepID=UPI002A6A66F8|nr:hypothetical protein [Acinetobacter haemolyticus]WPO68378.1 hypothetical protein SDC64_05470 [Acinetobacter haemolyticus]
MLKKIVSFLILFSMIEAVNASSVTGKVDRIIVRDSDGLVYVTFIGSRTEKPTCATASYMVIKNEASSTGKQQLALLLLAQATNRTVTVAGYSACTRWKDGEDINYIILNK